MSISKVLSQLSKMRSLNESTGVDSDAEGYVGKRFSVIDAIVTDKDQVTTGNTLIVKSVVDDELEIEVTAEDGEILGVIRSDLKSFEELINGGKLKGLEESDDLDDDDEDEDENDEDPKKATILKKAVISPETPSVESTNWYVSFDKASGKQLVSPILESLGVTEELISLGNDDLSFEVSSKEEGLKYSRELNKVLPVASESFRMTGVLHNACVHGPYTEDGLTTPQFSIFESLGFRIRHINGEFHGATLLESDDPPIGLDKIDGSSYDYTWTFDNQDQANDFISRANALLPEGSILIGPFVDTADYGDGMTDIITVALEPGNEEIANSIDNLASDALWDEGEDVEDDFDESALSDDEALIERVVKVVRHGKVVNKVIKRRKTKIKGARRRALKAFQKAGRKKARSAAARKSRAKSMRVRARKLESAMLSEFQQILSDSGVDVLGGGFEVTNEYINIEALVKEPTGEDIELNLDTLEQTLEESYGMSGIKIPTPAKSTVNGERVCVLNVLIKR